MLLCRSISNLFWGEGKAVLTYEDFEIGNSFPLGPQRLSEQEIIAFSELYDPQPMHLDPGSEQSRAMGGLMASGWHTCSLFMRMLCDSFLLDTASQGSGGLEEVNWLLPVRAGDTLSGNATVTDRRISQKRPDLGIVFFDYKMANQHGDVVLTMKGTGMIKVAPI